VLQHEHTVVSGFVGATGNLGVGKRRAPQQIATIMDKIDSNGSGIVTWDEFVQAAGVISSAFRMPIEPKIGWRQ